MQQLVYRCELFERFPVEKGEESVGKGVLLSEDAGDALRKILESARDSLELSRNISKSSQEQSRQADQILSFFEGLAEMIEQINTASQEQSRGTDQIIGAAEKMRDISV